MTTTSLRGTAVVTLAGLLLAGTVGVLVPAPAVAAYPGVSGRIFFQSDRDGNPHIYSMNPDGSRLVRLTSDGANTSPALSPDGTGSRSSTTGTCGRWTSTVAIVFR